MHLPALPSYRGFYKNCEQQHKHSQHEQTLKLFACARNKNAGTPHTDTLQQAGRQMCADMHFDPLLIHSHAANEPVCLSFYLCVSGSPAGRLLWLSSTPAAASHAHVVCSAF